MIKFLLQRPVAVLMVFLACVIIGIITYATLPVSLLPDIAIPEITVQVTGDNMSALSRKEVSLLVNYHYTPALRAVRGGSSPICARRGPGSG